MEKSWEEEEEMKKCAKKKAKLGRDEGSYLYSFSRIIRKRLCVKHLMLQATFIHKKIHSPNPKFGDSVRRSNLKKAKKKFISFLVKIRGPAGKRKEREERGGTNISLSLSFMNEKTRKKRGLCCRCWYNQERF